MGKAILRALRVSLGLGIAKFISIITQEPQLIWLSPIINALFKYLREKYPDKFKYIPL